MLLGQLDCTGDECVLRRSIDERCILEDTGNRKYSGGRYFLMAGFDGLHQIVCSVINPGNKVCIAFGVRSPLDDDFVQAMGSLEIPVEVRKCNSTREIRLTECPCGAFQRVPWTLWIPQECCLRDLLGLQQ